jgi:RHS repeat-associated protein
VPPIVSTAYTYDTASNRTGAFDARPKSSQPLSNMYAYDGLHRLVDARRGVWTGGLASPSVSQLKGSQEWALDPLGNWSSVGTDLDGAGGIDSDETETRDHRDPSLTPPTNRVNELYARELAPDTGGGTVDLSYDFAGNLLRQQLQSGGALRYTHDAWNRLVKVEFEDAEEDLHPRAEYEYNPLNWRTVERTDTNTADSTHALDEMRVHLYDASWRLLESRIDADFDPIETSPDFEEHAQLVWGLRYIDDIVSTRRDLNPAEEDGAEVRMFHATDAQFSSVAVLLDNGSLLERVAYSPYGVARHQWPADASGDGAVNSADLSIVLSSYGSITSTTYRSEADFNRDGNVDAADLAAVLSYAAALPEGALSSAGIANRTGYCGYRFAPETEMYLARNRWNSPPLGRWIQRDPLGYVDGMGLYEYVRGAPLNGVDPPGTRRQVIAFEGWGAAIGLGGRFVTYQSQLGRVVHDKVESTDWHYFDWTQFEAAKRTALNILTAPDSEAPRLCGVVGRFQTLAILGFSNGGDAAHDLAHDLSALGLEIDLVATLDPVPRGMKGVGDFLDGASGPNYSKSSTAKRWINYYQRIADPKGWPVAGADIDHQFTSSGKIAWKEVSGTQVKGLINVVSGTWFSFAEHSSIPELHTVLSEWRSSVSAMPEWRYAFRRPWESYK